MCDLTSHVLGSRAHNIARVSGQLHLGSRGLDSGPCAYTSSLVPRTYVVEESPGSHEASSALCIHDVGYVGMHEIKVKFFNEK